MVKNWRDVLIGPDATIWEAIALIDKSASQICLVVDKDNHLLGTVTDGDIRRAILSSTSLDEPVSGVLNPDPLTTNEGDDRRAMVEKLRSREIHHLPVIDSENRVIGLVLLENLLAPGKQIDNWVVLMAGGMGSRLKPLTDNVPKPLLNVGGKPLLETIINNFVAQDFRRFYISVNYKADMIEEFCGDGSRWNSEIRYLHEDDALGTAGALSMIKEKPESPILVMNADLLTNVDFRNLLKFHQEQRSAATMCVREFDMEVPFGVVSIDGQRIIRIDEKPIHRFLVNAGIYLVDPIVLDMIPPGQRTDMPEIFDKVIAADHPTAVFPIREYWLDVGQPDEYRIANGDIVRLFE